MISQGDVTRAVRGKEACCFAARSYRCLQWSQSGQCSIRLLALQKQRKVMGLGREEMIGPNPMTLFSHGDAPDLRGTWWEGLPGRPVHSPTMPYGTLQLWAEQVVALRFFPSSRPSSDLSPVSGLPSRDRIISEKNTGFLVFDSRLFKLHGEYSSYLNTSSLLMSSRSIPSGVILCF